MRRNSNTGMTTCQMTALRLLTTTAGSEEDENLHTPIIKMIASSCRLRRCRRRADTLSSTLLRPMLRTTRPQLTSAAEQLRLSTTLQARNKPRQHVDQVRNVTGDSSSLHCRSPGREEADVLELSRCRHDLPSSVDVPAASRLLHLDHDLAPAAVPSRERRCETAERTTKLGTLRSGRSKRGRVLNG